MAITLKKKVSLYARVTTNIRAKWGGGAYIKVPLDFFAGFHKEKSPLIYYLKKISHLKMVE